MTRPTRRDFLRAGAAAGAGLPLLDGSADPLATGGPDAGPEVDGGAGGGDAAPYGYTPECAETDDNLEGPFYKEGAPERTDLVEPGMAGVRLSLSGRVAGAACAPLAGAFL